VTDAAAVVSQHQKQIRHLEGDRHREKVHRDHCLDVILEEGALGLRWRLAMAHQILSDAGFADVDAQLKQLAVNARCFSGSTDPSGIGRGREVRRGGQSVQAARCSYR
jgi:hypothetical protein